MIQQLQDEIMGLRQGSSSAVQSGLGPSVPPGKPGDTNSTVNELQQKLKTAAKHIAQLARERQQLIEMGNKLRADMKNAGKIQIIFIIIYYIVQKFIKWKLCFILK